MASNSQHRLSSAISIEQELIACRVCGRTFVPDRITHHERICLATKGTNRAPYDSVKHRWEGTDNEPAIKWIKSKNEEQQPMNQLRTDAIDKNTLPFPKPAEDTSGPIAVEALPDDRVRCPGCRRSFSEEAAERHIPKCSQRNSQNK